MRCTGRNGGGEYDYHRPICRLIHRDRAALVDAVIGSGTVGRRHQTLPRRQQRDRIDGGAPDARIIRRQFLEILPAIQLCQRQHPGAHAAAERRMRGGDLAFPARVQQIGPGFGRDVRRHTVDAADQNEAGGVVRVVPAVVRQRAVHRRQPRCVRRFVSQQLPLLLQNRHVGDVGGTEHVAMRRLVLDIHLQPLKRDLPGHAHDIDGDAGMFGGERLA